MKKTVSLFLSILMVLSLLPLNAFALELSEENSEIYAKETEEIFEESEDCNEEPESQTEEDFFEENETLDASVIASGYCGGDENGTNLSWKLTAKGVLIISGDGEMEDYNSNDIVTTAPWGEYASDIKTLIINEGVTSIGAWAFHGCSEFSGSLVIPDSVTTISRFAFFYTDFDELVLGNGVEILGDRCFSGMEKLTEVDIPSSVKYGAEGAFNYSSGLVNIFVDEENENYSSVDGILCDKNGTKLLLIPLSREGELVIPQSIVTIGRSAFWNSNLSKIIIPENVKILEDSAFYNMRATFIIEGELDEIGKSAFRVYGSGKADIYFNGGAPKSVEYRNDNDPEEGSFAPVNGGRINLYYLSGTENLWEFDDYGFWNGYEVKSYAPPKELVDVSGYCGASDDGTNLSWNLNKSGVLTISGIGEMADFDENGAPWKEYSYQIRKIVLEEGITAIGDFAFYGCDKLNGKIIVPESVKEIGNFAFKDCWILSEELVIGDNLEIIGNYAFENCKGIIGNVIFPESLKEIYIGAFENCDIDNYYFKGDAPKIYDRAFDGSDDIIYYPAGNSTWKIVDGKWNGYSAVEYTGLYIASGTCGNNLIWNISEDGTLTVSGTGPMDNYSASNPAPWNKYKSKITKIVFEEGITSIGDNAFYICLNVKGGISIPETVTYIGKYAFFSCVGLTGDLIIPDSVRYIGYNAFFNCNGFKGNLVIGNGVTEIGSGAFASSGYKGTLTIGNSLKTIGGYAFAFNDFCGNLIIPNSVVTIKYDAFLNCGFDGNLIFGNSVDTIGSYAFYNTKFNGNLMIPDSVTKIGRHAFENCKGLKGEITIGDNVKIIEDCAFANCKFTGNLVIPDSVEKLGCHAFRMCKNLNPVAEIGSGIKNILAFTFAWCGANTYKFYGNAPEISKYRPFDKDVVIAYPINNSSWVIKNNKWNGYDTLIHNPDNPSIKLIGYCGNNGKNLEWSLDYSGTLVISGTGRMKDYYGYEDIDISFDWSEYLGDLLSDVGFKQVAPWKEYSNEIKTVIIENGVENIGNHAFTSCSNIEKVVLADSVEEIGTGAFLNCVTLSEANVFEKERTIGKGAFALTAIGGNLIIPDGAKVDVMAFAFSEIESVTVSAGADVEAHAFLMAANLKKIVVAASNASISSEDGVLFNKDKTELIQYPSNRDAENYKVPDSVEVIGPAAFGKAKLSDIELSAKTEIIDEFAFAFFDCEEIILPETVDVIKNHAFILSGIKSIYFEGNAPFVYAYEHEAPSLPLDVVVYYNKDDSSWVIDYEGKWNGYTAVETDRSVDAYLVIDSKTMAPGVSETVIVSLSENSEAVAVQFTLEYDPSVLEVVSCSAGELTEGATINYAKAGSIAFAWDDLKAISGAGTVLEIEIRAKTGIDSQKTEMDFNIEKAFVFKNADGDDIAVKTEKGIIDIIDLIYGDITGDGEVNVFDAYWARLIAAKLKVPTGTQKVVGDIDGDEKITAVDANLIRKFIVGIIEEIPIQK